MLEGMTTVRVRYVYRDRSRHGQVRLYFWRGPGTAKVRITEPEGSAEFHARVAALTRETEIAPIRPYAPARPGGALAPAGGTFGALAVAYMASPAFEDYDAATIKKRRNLLGHMVAEPVRPGAAETFRDMPLAAVTLAALEVLRDRAAKATTGQANERVKAMRALFKWALLPAQRPRFAGLRGDPAAGLKTIRVASEGWHTWTLAEIERFEARHPVGTRAHLALSIALYTGARRSDLIRLGRPHVQGGTGLRWTAAKGRRRHTTIVEIDILPPLAEALAHAPLGDVTWLVNELGRPFTHAGFGNWFRERCIDAGLSHCSAHGLRKAGATRAAENGASAHMLMAMFGWKNLAEAERYTKAAERKRMAKAGMQTLLIAARS